jgi:DNA-binding CsgD family transcriptional regulator
VLFGRDSECAVLDTLVRKAGGGGSGAVLVIGEAGIGKTALLQYAQGRGSDLTVLRATGSQAESNIPYATLHQLLRPVLSLAGSLAEAQKNALHAALGLADAGHPDRLLVASGVLSLLGEVGGEGGVLCVVDDLHWADPASFDALMFTARRLSAEGVAMLLAVRAQDGRRFEVPPDIAVMEVGNLAFSATLELLTARAPVEPTAEVAGQLFELTAGHPLALQELARELEPEVLSGEVSVPDPLPLTVGIEQVFLDQVRRLAPSSQLTLLVAALDTTGRVAVLLTVTETLKLGQAAVAQAEESGLLDLGAGANVHFRHPLVRSAVVANATPTQRRLVHSALSLALTDPADEDRRVWHAAACVVGADDEIADQLDRAAERASRRSAHAAAAKALTRAADLTVDQRVAATRHLRAARESWLAGQAEMASGALAAAAAATSDSLLRCEVAELKGHLELYQGDASEAHRILVQAAPAMAPERPLTALRMIFRAAEAALWTGNLAGVARCGQLAEAVDVGADRDAELLRDIDVGLASLFAGDPGAIDSLQSLVTEAAGRRDPDWLILASETGLALGRFADAGTTARQAVEAARDLGSTGLLPQALHLCALAEHAQGRYSTAAGLASQSIDLARETGQSSVLAAALAWSAATAAIRADDTGCQAAARQAAELAGPRRLVLVEVAAAQALAHSDMIQGRYGAALRRLTALDSMSTADATPSSQMFALGDRVEAAVRTGDLEVARVAVARLERWGHATGNPGATAIALRCRALIGDEVPGPLFSESLAVHPQGESPLELARTQLLYGEWLRRARRRIEAREQLRAAGDTFERLGCEPLAERARGELRATGETVKADRSPGLASLTPQELAISRLVAEGASNREAATVLYLSPRTVEYHLHKIFTKLAVGSRTELAHVVANVTPV